MEIQSQVCRRLPRQRVCWVLRRRCAVDRRGDGHIPGRCSKCPKVDCLDWQMRSCSCRQFIRTGSCEDVSHTQNARTVRKVATAKTQCNLRGRRSSVMSAFWPLAIKMEEAVTAVTVKWAKLDCEWASNQRYSTNHACTATSANLIVRGTRVSP